MKKIVIIASTNGSVLSKVINMQLMKDNIFMIVSDRECGAIHLAKENNIAHKIFQSANGADFSNKLYEFFCSLEIDMFFSFYTRIFSGQFLKTFKGKILNFHPSILPACPGRKGFEDTVAFGAKFIGSTLHLVDEGIDTGKPIIQSITPFDPSLNLEINRHKVFIQQCKIFIQAVEWLLQDRLHEEMIIDGKYEFSEFVPNLESALAINFTC